MSYFRFLTLPFALIYGLITFIYHKLYDWNILRSTSFNIPVISIGNLSTGGTGKTPLTEFIINMLKREYTIAVLSRGYNRKTKGFRLVNETDPFSETGDEPLQIKLKFKNDIVVAVDENRVHGIEQIMKLFPRTQLILLDDAFQHRPVKAGLSILLTPYQKPYYKDLMLPAGNLREFRGGSKRADIIIITKTPGILTQKEKEKITGKIKPLPEQKVLFSWLKYTSPMPFTLRADKQIPPINPTCHVLLFTGIANNTSLVNYVKEQTKSLTIIEFPDHHNFSAGDIEKIKTHFGSIKQTNKIIVTTEKDATRFYRNKLFEMIKDLPVYYLSIEPAFDEGDLVTLRKALKDFIN